MGNQPFEYSEGQEDLGRWEG